MAVPAASAPHHGAARPLRHALRLPRLRSGGWFHYLLLEFLRRYDATHPRPQAARPDAVPEAMRIIRRASAKAAAIGTGAAAITAGAQLWIAQSEGLGVLAAVPLSAGAIAGDLLARTWVHLHMTCDVAALFGVRFASEDPADLAGLYAIALGAVDPLEAEDERGRHTLERVTARRSEESGRLAGALLGNETVLRDIVPFFGLFASGVGSWRTTHRLGQASLWYARARRALDDALRDVCAVASDCRELLTEGVWFLFTSDGRLTGPECAILSYLLRRPPAQARRAILDRLGDDEAGWLERLQEVPAPARRAFLRTLEVAAALDTRILEPERKLLDRAGRVLGQRSDPAELDALASRLRDTGLV